MKVLKINTIYCKGVKMSEKNLPRYCLDLKGAWERQGELKFFDIFYKIITMEWHGHL